MNSFGDILNAVHHIIVEVVSRAGEHFVSRRRGTVETDMVFIKAGFFEGLTSLPLALVQAADFNTRGALPHHNETAVNDSSLGADHKLYSSSAKSSDDRQSYANQFRWRVNTAIQHIQQALTENYHP